jgi:hypothetical protein
MCNSVVVFPCAAAWSKSGSSPWPMVNEPLVHFDHSLWKWSWNHFVTRHLETLESVAPILLLVLLTNNILRHERPMVRRLLDSGSHAAVTCKEKKNSLVISVTGQGKASRQALYRLQIPCFRRWGRGAGLSQGAHVLPQSSSLPPPLQAAASRWNGVESDACVTIILLPISIAASASASLVE